MVPSGLFGREYEIEPALNAEVRDRRSGCRTRPASTAASLGSIEYIGDVRGGRFQLPCPGPATKAIAEVE
jgi:hypothetical protein